MTLKSDAKFEGNVTCGLKNDIRNLFNFHVSSRKSENLHFDWSLLFKAYKDLCEKYRRLCLCFMKLKRDAKFEENPTLGSKNDMRNSVNFNARSGKSENLHFDVLLLLIPCKVPAKKLQKNYLWWKLKKIQTLKKDWLFAKKWHEEFGEL